MIQGPPAAAIEAEPVAVSLVETDAFCDCGYNLHGQRVWRDENLGLLVCRCPECGRHAAAGRFTGIHSVWLHRVSTAMIVAWVVFLLGVFAFLIPMCAFWPNVHMGWAVTAQPVPGQGPNPTMYEWIFRTDAWANYRTWKTDAVVELFMAALNGWTVGAVVAVFMWHVKRRGYLIVLIPLAISGLVYLGWAEGMWPLRADVRAWVVRWVVAYALLESAMAGIGVRTGRPVARFVLGLLLPPRLLQHLAFLWFRDGKTPAFEKPAG